MASKKIRAIISDIHANFGALMAVMNDILSRNISDIICLGDVVGYGPNPRECLDYAKSFRITLMGNHEEALMQELRTYGFNPKATGARDWTYSQFDLLDPKNKEENAKRWDFLGELQEIVREDDVMYCHGSPCEPTREYIYDRDVLKPAMMKRVFAEIDHVCFVGHTHFPGVFLEQRQYLSPVQLPKIFQLPQQKVIVNVGSVGQPRDGDARACYVIFDGSAIAYIRVEYDVQETARRIFETEGLDNSLGERLLIGR